MELKVFIEETIKAIADGLQGGEKHVKTLSNNLDFSARHDGYVKVDFDVAVSSNEGEKGSVGAGISVVQVLNAGGKTETEKSIAASSRITFSVLMDFPRAKRP